MEPDPDPHAFDLAPVIGGWTVRSRIHRETFHPVLGPMGEAELLHVRQQRLQERADAAAQFVVWDVGLGAAANAIATLDALRNSRARVLLLSFEKDLSSLNFARTYAGKLGYLDRYQNELSLLVRDGMARVGSVEWRLRLGDFRAVVSCLQLPAPDAVMYDPYSSKSNPEMWTLEAFRTLHGCLSQPCLLTNYTRSTAVRVGFLLAGFYVGRGLPIADKEETTVASNYLEFLDAPLDREWLEKVRRSKRAAPPRDRTASAPGGAISDEDWGALCSSPQFQPAR